MIDIIQGEKHYLRQNINIVLGVGFCALSGNGHFNGIELTENVMWKKHHKGNGWF